MKFIKIILITALLFSQTAWTENNDEKEDAELSIRTAADIFKMLEESELVYMLDILDTTKQYPQKEKRVIQDYFFIKDNEGERTLHAYTLNDSAALYYNNADSLFYERNYPQSLEAYQKALYFDSSYDVFYTLIADVFYITGEFDSAIYYFEKSLEKNFYNFQSHWFYADLLWKTGETEKCLDHIITAHLLNINHVNAFNIMRTYLFESGKEWKDWSFDPVYKIFEDSGKVRVQFDPRHPEYMPYVLARALWKFEPGYAEKMLGKDYDKETDWNSFEEREAVIAYLTTVDSTDMIYQLTLDGYLDEFIVYEIMAPVNPEVMYLLSEETFYNIKEYVEKYH